MNIILPDSLYSFDYILQIISISLVVYIIIKHQYTISPIFFTNHKPNTAIHCIFNK